MTRVRVSRSGRKAPSVRYHQLVDGEWYAPVHRGHMEQCCDCGLVHRVDFRVAIAGQRVQVEMRARRDDRATAEARRRLI